MQVPLPPPPTYNFHLLDQGEEDLLPHYISTNLMIIPTSSENALAVVHPGSTTPSYTLTLDHSAINAKTKLQNNTTALVNVDQFRMRTLQDEVPSIKIIDSHDRTLLATITPFSTQPGPFQNLEFKVATNYGDCVFNLTPGGFKRNNLCSFKLPTTRANYHWESSIDRDDLKPGRKITLTLFLEAEKEETNKIGTFFKKLAPKSYSEKIAVATYETVTPSGSDKKVKKGTLTPLGGAEPWKSRDECGVFIGSVVAAVYGIAYEIDVIRTVDINRRLVMSHQHHG
ncbi:UNVERIFIED_CONTAM: hypothetical protein HDU68_012684 [Siphonaria sp. JEL0065]|nr:hypothetical protein HDU68_012684 [Siphonaria sp. JEL0065]